MTPVFAALFGLAFGSFVNAAIERVSRGESIDGRSHCDGCARVLRVWELVPVMSYAALRGRCSSCHTLIGLRTPLVEVSGAAAFAAAFWALDTPVAVAACGALVSIAVMSGVVMQKRSVKS